MNDMLKSKMKKKLPHLKKTRLSKKICKFIWHKCMFCQKMYIGNVKKLYQVCTNGGQKHIVISANKRNNSNLQIQIDSVKGDMIAAGAVYHKVCRDRYINDRLCSGGREFVNVYEQCFMKLVDEIDTGLIYENRVYEMSQLRDMYEKKLNDAYPNEGTQIQTKQIKSKLLKHYGSNNIVFQDQYDRKMSQLVYSSKISLKDVINAVARQNSATPYSSREDGTDVGVQDACATLFHAANIIREDIKKCKGISIKPLNVTDITENKAKELLHDSVFSFLYWVIQGTSDTQPDALTLAEKQETLISIKDRSCP